MKIVRTIEDARAEVAAVRAAGRRVGFVPTMGFLHEGHLSLVDRCRELADYVVMSIYVNPLQFGPNEDFEAYPRDFDRDVALAQDRGVDLVFAPGDGELYPGDLTVAVTPKRLADRLCGLSRPGHFEGVLTVVCKLFGIVTPDVAVFGQKDFQQSVLIRKMVADLDLPVRVDVAPTIRDPDGLAMSSRNAYLTPAERRAALALPRALAEAVRLYRAGERSAGRLRAAALETVEAAGGADVEYLEIVSATDLTPSEVADDDAVMAVAARVGETRLIDNCRLARPDSALERHL